MFRQFIRKLANWSALPAAPAGGGAQDCSGTIIEAQALQAETERYAAQMKGDVAAMQRLIGDDLVYIHSSTVQDTKASFIESIRSGNVKYRTTHRGEVKVRTYGCIAIISGSGRFEVTVKGEDRILDLLFHAICAKRAAGVQFVSCQATRLPSK